MSPKRYPSLRWRLKVKSPKLGTSCTTICMSRQYRRRCKKKILPDSCSTIQAVTCAMVRRSFRPLLCPPFLLGFAPTPLPLTFSSVPPHRDTATLSPEFNSQRKRSMKGVPAARGNASKSWRERRTEAGCSQHARRF